MVQTSHQSHSNVIPTLFGHHSTNIYNHHKSISKASQKHSKHISDTFKKQRSVFRSLDRSLARYLPTYFQKIFSTQAKIILIHSKIGPTSFPNHSKVRFKLSQNHYHNNTTTNQEHFNNIQKSF